jgi:hypothetical protein
MSKSTGNEGSAGIASEVRQLRRRAEGNTRTRVIGPKLARTPSASCNKASCEVVSLAPLKQSPYNFAKKR